MNSKLVLYVEDEEDDVFLMRRAFARSELDCLLDVASDGRAAVEYLSGKLSLGKDSLPLLVLLDLNLPILSGLEVLRWVRSTPSLATLVVIMFSSSNQASDLERAYSLGANSYIIKPSTPAELLKAVKSLLEYWQLHNQQAPAQKSP